MTEIRRLSAGDAAAAAEIEKAYEQINDACKKGILLTQNGGTEE